MRSFFGCLFGAAFGFIIAMLVIISATLGGLAVVLRVYRAQYPRSTVPEIGSREAAYLSVAIFIVAVLLLGIWLGIRDRLPPR
jgi:hypothetical protein